MIHCAADLRIRQLGNFTSTILRKTRAALTSAAYRSQLPECHCAAHARTTQPQLPNRDVLEGTVQHWPGRLIACLSSYTERRTLNGGNPAWSSCRPAHS